MNPHFSNPYPLVFNPIYKENLWGGQRLSTHLNKEIPSLKTGESWEISFVDSNVSVVENGAFKGESLDNILNDFANQILGPKVYAKHGSKFPLLIKFIDANDDLSLQVHPDDHLAKLRYNQLGKSEMWYVLQADKGAKILAGMQPNITPNECLALLSKGNWSEALQVYYPQKGDAFYIPAGTPHAIGSGILLAEIQQSSNITYRIYDYNRKDDKGKQRQLHLEEAHMAIKANQTPVLCPYQAKENQWKSICHTPYFLVDAAMFNKPLNVSIEKKESFVVLINIEGSLTLEYPNGSLLLKKGQTTLLPFALKEMRLVPNLGYSEVLLSYMPI